MYDLTNTTIIPTGTVTPKLTADLIAGTARVLAQSAVPLVKTGDTVETALATITIPGGMLGPNGSVRITTLWTHTNSANNKNMRVKFGGTQISVNTVTTTAASRDQRQINNRGSASSQIAFQGGTGGLGATTGAPVTTAFDTAAPVDITLTAQLALGTETMTLEAYTVEVLYA